MRGEVEAVYIKCSFDSSRLSKVALELKSHESQVSTDERYYDGASLKF